LAKKKEKAKSWKNFNPQGHPWPAAMTAHPQNEISLSYADSAEFDI